MSDDVKIGQYIKIDAGLLEVEVLEKKPGYIIVKALNNFLV
ncbi:MAG: hypothetical protein WCL02_00865 [bacterium]